MREISLDTETTGFKFANGDRLVEIGCVEMVNRIPTGKTYHVYINPERNVPEEAYKVHGLSSEFLKDKPKFKEIAQDFLDFIADSPLVIHNAPFDMDFLQNELVYAGFERLANPVIDTLVIARKNLPGRQHSLDNLCKIYGVDNSGRNLHGALIDADLLASVYLELKGGANYSMKLEDDRPTIRKKRTPFDKIKVKKPALAAASPEDDRPVDRKITMASLTEDDRSRVFKPF